MFSTHFEASAMKPRILLLTALFTLGGVPIENASADVSPAPLKTSPESALLPYTDPYESANRKLYGFNQWLVFAVVEPLADWLDKKLSKPVKQAGQNIYANLVEPEFIVTNWMVGDSQAAWASAQRFLINSTVGVAGLWDPASRMGIYRTEVEFTEALCTAGMDPGNYVVLPAVGPVSSTSAMLVTGFFAVEWYLLAILSPTIATIDLVIDLSASAASLRYARDLPDGALQDPYIYQRTGYRAYLEPRCGQYLRGKPD
ncbi:phospholipid-binding lipoprotein MlaA [Gammaproteobacteria bacterium]